MKHYKKIFTSTLLLSFAFCGVISSHEGDPDDDENDQRISSKVEKTFKENSDHGNNEADSLKADSVKDVSTQQEGEETKASDEDKNAPVDHVASHTTEPNEPIDTSKVVEETFSNESARYFGTQVPDSMVTQQSQSSKPSIESLSPVSENKKVEIEEVVNPSKTEPLIAKLEHPEPTSEEKNLIAHMQESLFKADVEESKLPQGIISLEDNAGKKIRHFLNNLCSQSRRINYLQIGCNNGAEVASVVYQNQYAVETAIIIENWGQNLQAMYKLMTNLELTIPGFPVQVFRTNPFSAQKEKIFTKPVNVYYYNGSCESKDVEQAFTYYNEYLDDVFVVIINGWNKKDVRNSVESTFEKLGYALLAKKVMIEKNRSKDQLEAKYIAVVRKQK